METRTIIVRGRRGYQRTVESPFTDEEAIAALCAHVDESEEPDAFALDLVERHRAGQRLNDRQRRWAHARAVDLEGGWLE